MTHSIVHLFATKNDLLDIQTELKKFASDYGVEIHEPENPMWMNKAVFILSQYADDNFTNDQIKLTTFQETYIALVKRYINAKLDQVKPAIYIFIRSELVKEYNIWRKRFKETQWLIGKLINIYKQDNLDQFLEQLESARKRLNSKMKTDQSDQNEVYLLNSIQQHDSLHTADDEEFFGLRRKQALLLFLFIFIHENNKRNKEYSNNWYTTFNNIVDLKENLRYALFPPLIAVDFHKTLVAGGLPVLAVSLQRFEWIFKNRYELCFKVTNSGKTPVFAYGEESNQFLQIKNRKAQKGSLVLLKPPQFSPGFPPVFAAGHSVSIRLFIDEDDNCPDKEYLLIFRYRSVQSFAIENTFILKYNKDSRHRQLVFTSYEKIKDPE